MRPIAVGSPSDPLSWLVFFHAPGEARDEYGHFLPGFTTEDDHRIAARVPFYRLISEVGDGR